MDGSYAGEGLIGLTFRYAGDDRDSEIVRGVVGLADGYVAVRRDGEVRNESLAYVVSALSEHDARYAGLADLAAAVRAAERSAVRYMAAILRGDGPEACEGGVTEAVERLDAAVDFLRDGASAAEPTAASRPRR